MKRIEYWKKKGFVYETTFPDEYALWTNRSTMQRLRIYMNGSEWLTDKKTGKYRLVERCAR